MLERPFLPSQGDWASLTSLSQNPHEDTAEILGPPQKFSESKLPFLSEKDQVTFKVSEVSTL